MKTSVVLSTYNGAKYLIELLDSLRKQTMEIDEVLISDDASTDDTVRIIKNYIRKWELSKWHLVINTENKGWKKNFYDLILKCEGEYIFPCDQDDIWDSKKIEHSVLAMEQCENALLLCSDYEIFYMNDSVAFPSTKVSKVSGTGNFEKLNSKKAIQVVDRPGCTYCFRKQLRPIIEKIWFEDCPHDAVAWRAACICDSIYILHEKLIKFRRHNHNASDKVRKKANERAEIASYYITVFNKLLSYQGEYRTHKIDEYLLKCIKAQEARYMYLTNRSALGWIYNLPRSVFLPSIRTYIADGISVLSRN